MLKVSFTAAVVMVGFISAAHANSTRPGSDSAGGRIGAVCNTSMLSAPEKDDCIAKMKAAKTNAERREIRDVLRASIKERQKELDARNENTTPGGANTARGAQ